MLEFLEMTFVNLGSRKLDRVNLMQRQLLVAVAVIDDELLNSSCQGKSPYVVVVTEI